MDSKNIKKESKDIKKGNTVVLKENPEPTIVKEMIVEKKGLFCDSFVFYGVPVLRLS